VMRPHNERHPRTPARPGLNLMVQLHNYLAPLLLGALLLGFGGRAHAYNDVKVSFMGDFVQGLSIPIADGNYKKFADPSYKMGVRLGAVFYINRQIGVAPEGEFDFIPINSNDGTYQNNTVDARFYRVRGLVGGRLIIPFGIGSFYARVAFGVDYITGTLGSTLLAGPTVSYTSTAFTFEPGFGVQFNVIKHLVVGITTGFPIAAHDTGTNHPLLFLNSSSFTAVDIDFLAVLGVRL
jgi:hypothetical protein